MSYFPPWTPAACICVDLVTDPVCPLHNPQVNRFDSEVLAYAATHAPSVEYKAMPNQQWASPVEDCQNENPPKMEFVKPGVEIASYETLQDVIDEQNAYIQRLEEDNDTLLEEIEHIGGIVAKVTKALDELYGFSPWTDEELEEEAKK